MRRPLVVGNWKMNGSLAKNESLLGEMIAAFSTDTSAQLAVCVPTIYIPQVSALLANTSIGLGAQDISVHINGAYTGETSSSMLADFTCEYALVGHSERRQYHHESDILVAQKTLAAIQAGIVPIVCLGETLEQREAGETLAVIGQQLAAVKNIVAANMHKTVVAYEPVWAIGTGLTATPEQAQEVHAFIRGQLGEAADSVSILYGGSVKADNAQQLFAQKDIDGALVGGASLVAADFIHISQAAA